jgi:hypothetical protein
VAWVGGILGCSSSHKGLTELTPLTPPEAEEPAKAPALFGNPAMAKMGLLS